MKKRRIHLKQTLLLRFNTFKEGRIRELELVVFGSLKSVIRLGLRNLSNELLKVATVSAELEAVQVQDIRDGVVEETGIVRDDD